jgi:hypothetical protein
MMKHAIVLLAAAGTALLGPAAALAQGSPREAAPVDLTGFWVAPVMEDWRWRMVAPLKGDAASIPLRQSSRAVVEAWDPERDIANGDECKAYGPPGLLRLPGRIRIQWRGEDTLVIEKDRGMQMRVLRFGRETRGARSRQGDSVAHWDPGLPQPPAGVGFLGTAPRIGAESKTLIVETSNMLPGYLRKNGIPYSEETTVTEYFDTFTAVDGSEWFTVTSVVDDPVHLAVPWVTSTDYKRAPDGSGWTPEPCSAY